MSTKPRLARKAKFAAIAGGASVLLVLATAIPAEAASTTYHITAELNCVGGLFQSGNFRAHAANTGASIKLTKDNWWKSEWELRIGLRNTSGTQVTKSLQFAPDNRASHAFANTSGGSGIPGTSIAVNARVETMGNGGCTLFPPTFEGNLTQ